MTSLANVVSCFVVDYDPEDILEPLNDKDDSENENDLDESGARDHYVSVGKSKLRNEQPLLDDPRYAGKRTNRKDLYFEDEFDEEEVSGSEVEEEEDEAKGNNDSFDDEEDLLANADSNEEEEESDEDDVEESGAEESENEAEVEGDDEINTELRRIQEEEKYVEIYHLD